MAMARRIFIRPCARKAVVLGFALTWACATSRGQTTAAGLSPHLVETRVYELLNAGRQSDAEELLATQAALYPSSQRLAFLRAALMRSRFMKQASVPAFAAVAEMGTNTAWGACAFHMVYLDLHRDSEEHFAALRDLVERNPDDVMLRWMIAVQCREYRKNEEGVGHYGKLLSQWNPGPVLVHQTYANLLDGLGRYEEALVERRKAVELEPAGWSYQGLGNTLTSLKRFKEAEEAYRRSVELAPDRSAYWTSWGWGLLKAGRLQDAIAKCETATRLNPADFRAWSHWGDCLERLGSKEEALAKFRNALAANESDSYARKRIVELEKTLTAHPVGSAPRAPAMVPPPIARQIPAAARVDQSQREFERDNDWDEGNAQVFTAGRRGFLEAIRLPVFRMQGECGLVLELMHVDGNGAPTGAVLSRAFLPGSAFAPWTLKWYTIPFDKPYEQKAGEALCFVLRYVDAQSGPYGWLCIGGSMRNPYPDGHLYYTQIYGPQRWKYTDKQIDLAFETLVTGRPELQISASADRARLSTRESLDMTSYRLQFTSNLTSGVWSDVAVTNRLTADGGWDVPLGPGNAGFYRLVVQEDKL